MPRGGSRFAGKVLILYLFLQMQSSEFQKKVLSPSYTKKPGFKNISAYFAVRKSGHRRIYGKLSDFQLNKFVMPGRA
ncbi:hypothetical protein PSAB_02010 [Paenibacillus sabinae T27]|uniref:Uncharacterized protein n=1 Tax=Paenibacillus sabinae T27 TaxID=1268072 RepID=X4ZSF9_9BACL|nr:hypothetical protein PSAB_02010 [Paenibacillus sabinae T27]